MNVAAKILKPSKKKQAIKDLVNWSPAISVIAESGKKVEHTPGSLLREKPP